jgi:hypothetical protein
MTSAREPEEAFLIEETPFDYTSFADDYPRSAIEALIERPSPTGPLSII